MFKLITKKLEASKKFEFAIAAGIFFLAVVFSSKFLDSKSSNFFTGTIGAFNFTFLTLGFNKSVKKKHDTP